MELSTTQKKVKTSSNVGRGKIRTKKKTLRKEEKYIRKNTKTSKFCRISKIKICTKNRLRKAEIDVIKINQYFKTKEKGSKLGC